MMLIAAVLLAAAPVCNPSAVPNAEASAACEDARSAFQPQALAEADRAEIKRQAQLLLFDAASAQWQWPPRTAKYVYCGMVNGKNVAGSYTGWRPFYYVDEKLRILNPTDSRTDYAILCSSAGYIPRPSWLANDSGEGADPFGLGPILKSP
jgi:hypothetical protein